MKNNVNENELINKYIIIRTFCDKREIADKIINNLLEKKLVAGSQIERINSKYWWDNKVEECYEYKLEFRTKKSLFDKIETEIKKIHDYEVCEISCTEILKANDEFLKWIDENTID